MTDLSILSAVLKRCSPSEQSRLQTALGSLNHCFSQLAPTISSSSDEQPDPDAKPRLPAPAAARFCSWTACAPRFVFVLTPSNKLVRSADRGRTWTAIDVMPTASSNAVTKIRLLCMSCSSNTGAVAVAGTHGFLALSPSLAAPFVSLTTDDTATFESLFPPNNNNNKDQIFRRVFFNGRGNLLFAATSTMICCCPLIGASSSRKWTVLYRVPADKDVVISETTLLREDAAGTTFEIAAFMQKTMLMFQIVGTASSSSGDGGLTSLAIARRISIPVKIGSVMRCTEVALFAQSDRDHNCSAGVDASTPLSSADAFRRRFAACRAQFRPGLEPAAAKAADRRRRYDYCVGSPIPRAMVPSATEFFRGSVGPSARAATAATTAASELLDDLADEDAFLSAFRGGLLPPDTVPRAFKCYCTGGEVTQADHTCWLWLWMGEDDTAAPSKEYDDDDDDDDDEQQAEARPPMPNAAAFSTATNVSYLPLVQSNPLTDTVGLVVLGGGRQLVRASAAGVSSSSDAGRTWTEPQLSCLVAAAALDSQSVLAVSSRAAVAKLSAASGGGSNKPKIHASKTQQSLQKSTTTTSTTTSAPLSWALAPLPTSLGVSICTDVCVMN